VLYSNEAENFFEKLLSCISFPKQKHNRKNSKDDFTMDQHSSEMTYNIQQVSQITGLSKLVIRKWEERYGIVNFSFCLLNVLRNRVSPLRQVACHWHCATCLRGGANRQRRMNADDMRDANVKPAANAAMGLVALCIE